MKALKWIGIAAGAYVAFVIAFETLYLGWYQPKLERLPIAMLVITTTVLVKSTVRPLPSVSLPSSKIARKMLKIWGCAFSISSSKITEYGLRLTASVS